MPRTPAREQRDTAPYAAFPEQVLGANLRALRLIQGLDQGQVARRMAAQGHRWHQATASSVELGERGVTVGELFGLAVALDRSIPTLLDPAGVADSGPDGIEIGGRLLPAEVARKWLTDDPSRLGIHWDNDARWSGPSRFRQGTHRVRPSPYLERYDPDASEQLEDRYRQLAAADDLGDPELARNLRFLIGALFTGVRPAGVRDLADELATRLDDADPDALSDDARALAADTLAHARRVTARS